MGRRRVRRVVWPTFAVFLIGVFGAITVWIVHTALLQGAALQVLAAAAWIASFGFGWRSFSRSHGDSLPGRPRREISNRWVQWGPVLGVIASSVLLAFSNRVQMVGLALISGFMWPGFYWMIRAFVKHPQRRERLWSGQLEQFEDAASK